MDDAPRDDAPRTDLPHTDAPRTDAPRSRYSGGLRAADVDREATATRLRRSYSEGRLDQHEYEERIDRCYAAKHIGELGELTLDLPQEGPQSQYGSHNGSLYTSRDGLHDGPRGYEQEPGAQWPDPRRLAWRLMPLVPVMFVLILLSALTHHHLFWFPWPLLLFLFWGPFGRRWRARRNR